MSDSSTEEHLDEAPSSEGPDDTAEVDDLTPEEQMALYEESLKNSDWGHQPC